MRERDYEYEEVIEFIEEKLNQGIPISLREIARKFNTSHSQIKRVLLKSNYYDEFLRRKEDILNRIEEDYEDISDLPDKIYDIQKKPKVDREVNLNLDLKEEDITDLLKYESKRKKSKNPFFKPVKRVGFITDIHLGHHNEEALNLALSYLKAMNINTLVIGGDVIDNESVSFWKNKGTLTLQEEIEMGRKFAKEIREFFGEDVDVFWIEGNHSSRLERYILSKAEKLLDLEELKLPNLLRLKDYNIKWADTKEYLQKYGHPFHIGKLNFIHGHEIRASYGVVNVARTLYLKAHDNIMFGHFHVSQEYIQKDIRGNVRGAWAVGCLCDLTPDYAPVNNWVNGFAYIEFDEDGNFIVYNKKIIDGMIL